MPSRSDVTDFGAGPASLPTDVLEEAAKALLNYQATGRGSMELPFQHIPKRHLEMTFRQLS